MVRGKNEYLYGSVRAEMVVKVEASEKRVNFVDFVVQASSVHCHHRRY